MAYNGNSFYNAYSCNTSFNVDKQDIIITYDAITDTQYKDNVTICGKIVDVNGRPLSNINALITINNKLYKAKTDNDGVFRFTTAANLVGVNNVTLAYNGNSFYNAYSCNTTFNVDKQNITITYEPIEDTVCGENVTINGKVIDITGKALKNINVLIHINSKLYKAKTDSIGAFVFTTAANILGTNNVTLGYAGNAYYNSYETTTTFKVKN